MVKSMIKKEKEILSSKWPENIEKALDLTLGAKYFRCAFAVHSRQIHLVT